PSMIHPVLSLTRIQRKLGRLSHKLLQTPGELARLERCDSPRLQAVARAIRQVQRHDFSKAEQDWLNRLADRRATLSASTERIQVTDYGAGDQFNLYAEDATETDRTIERVVGSVCRGGSKSARWAELLFALIRQLKPATCIEFGTSLGLSALYQMAALELNGEGSFITLEGAPALATIARQGFESLKLAHRGEVLVGPFEQTLPALLARNLRIDYVFNDGVHEESAEWGIHRALLPYFAPDTTLVFDDIAWSPSMERFWQGITHDPGIAATIDHLALGVCLISPTITGHPYFRIAID
ncbi:MAG: class I SAM-dependent methyltransferase, partial [bacterium]